MCGAAVQKMFSDVGGFIGGILGAPPPKSTKAAVFEDPADSINEPVRSSIAAERARAEALDKKGRSASILSGGSGVTTEAKTRQPTLLGV
jgi:hypothetical protein